MSKTTETKCDIDQHADLAALTIGRIIVEIKLLERKIEELEDKLNVILVILTLSFYVLLMTGVYVWLLYNRP